jgi:hypothetical protein
MLPDAIDAELTFKLESQGSSHEGTAQCASIPLNLRETGGSRTGNSVTVIVQKTWAVNKRKKGWLSSVNICWLLILQELGACNMHR